MSRKKPLRSITSKVLLALLTTVLMNAPAFADESCKPILQLIHAAQTEFKDLIGEKAEIEVANGLEVFEGTLLLGADNFCSVAKQTQGEHRFSTSYTCGVPTNDMQLTIDQLKTQLSDCVGVQDWVEQKGLSGPTVSVARYGLLRLSISHHETGPGLGIEVFRDEAGRIVGSPYRGDQKMPDGSQLCTPKSNAELHELYKMYASRPGAETFENNEFYGVTNQSNSTIVAFVTKPVHPAHPALITRGIRESNGKVYLTASGDFAGDCLAFHGLLAEVRQMNEGMKDK